MSRKKRDDGAPQHRTRTRRGRPPLRSSDETGNRTISVGLDVLRTVGHLSAPATLTEIAQAVGMPVARTSRYLASLTRSDFLRHDKAIGKFELGPAVLELAASAMARMDPVRLTVDLMRPLSEATGLLSVLYVWGSHGPTGIKWEQGPYYIPIRIREGINISLITTAAGRIFLAYHDSVEVRPILERDIRAWNATTSDRKVTNKDVRTLKSDILREGLARAEALNNPALSALAAPIFGPDRRLLMSLALVGVAGAIDTSYSGEPAQKLKDTAARLSRMLGG